MIRLSPRQEEVVEHTEGALLVIAGAGSGKTRVLTERVRKLIEEKKGHYRVLALTFTNKAAEEMRERLSDIVDLDSKAFIGTLHSFCLEVIYARGKVLGFAGEPHIFESDADLAQILKEVFQLKPELQSILKARLAQDKKYLFKVREFISEQKRELRGPEWFEGRSDINDDDRLFAGIYKQYNDILRAQNAIDYDDLLLLAYRIFTERPKIAEMYRNLFRYICVDEAQDLNFAQYNVIKALCGQDCKNVMMVGDPRQAIYGFNGASSDYMSVYFKEDFDAKVIDLSENYRSSEAIICAAQKLETSFEIIGRTPIPGEIRVISFDDENQEADWVISKFRSLINEGHPDIEGVMRWDRFAVLARNRYILNTIEKKLVDLKIPHYTKVANLSESESEYLRCFELGLRLLINPIDRLHLQQLLQLLDASDIYEKIPSFKKGIDLLSFICQSTALKNDSCCHALMSAWKEIDIDNLKFKAALSVLQDCANQSFINEELSLITDDIKMWHDHWEKYVRMSTGGGRTLVQFRNQIALGTTKKNEQNGIALLTVHTSKGLEFDVVCIMGMSEGTFPDYRAIRDGNKALREEKHNCFVAVTRSKRLLYLTYSQEKIMPWGDKKRQEPSRYITEMNLPIETISNLHMEADK